MSASEEITAENYNLVVNTDNCVIIENGKILLQRIRGKSIVNIILRSFVHNVVFYSR